jgi:type VI secretion system protein ImpE
MDPKELIRAGRLSEARTQLIEEVKSSPSDAGIRTLLFQVRSFCGEWDKAERDLDIIAAMDAGKEAGVQVYKNLVHAEKERMEVFRNGRRPSFMPQTPPYTEVYFTAREKLAGKEFDEAKELFDQIDARIPVISGTVNGKSFTGMKDTDIYVSHFLEAFAHERYVWIPFESIRELSITPPKSLFDLLWCSAVITTWEGLTLNCFLPVIYAGSYANEDDRIRLGRMTDWTPLGGTYAKGLGQHVFQIGEEEVPMLEIHEILFNPPAEVHDEKRD